jgi:UDP-glucose 4-epimerase
VFADPALAEEELGWMAQRDIEAMCADAWNWQKQNPEGY